MLYKPDGLYVLLIYAAFMAPFKSFHSNNVPVLRLKNNSLLKWWYLADKAFVYFL